MYHIVRIYGIGNSVGGAVSHITGGSVDIEDGQRPRVTTNNAPADR